MLTSNPTILLFQMCMCVSKIPHFTRCTDYSLTVVFTLVFWRFFFWESVSLYCFHFFSISSSSVLHSVSFSPSFLRFCSTVFLPVDPRICSIHPGCRCEGCPRALIGFHGAQLQWRVEPAGRGWRAGDVSGRRHLSHLATSFPPG